MTDIATLGAHLHTSSPLAQRAKQLLPLLDRHAPHADQDGRLAPEVVGALRQDRLFLMWTPKELGGFELDPVQSLDVLAIASYGDASAGWVLMAANLAIGTAGAYLGDSAAAELFAAGAYPVIAGQGTRPGTATRVEGGFTLTGSWSFGSGLLHSTHTHSLAIIAETGEARIFVTPVEQANLKLDSWDVMGLRGTGSVDYTIEGVFVPEAYSHAAFTTEPLRGGAIFRSGIMGFAEICHSGWAVGVGRRLLDELGALIVGKAGRPGALSASDSFQEKYAKLEASYRAARALVYETWTDVTRTMTAGSPLSVRQHTMIRLALGHITHALADVASGVYLLSGTTGLRRGPIERLVRDVHAGTQHITSAPVMWQSAGRELAGLAPGKHWVLLDLVDD
jgi:alkylation response protein AidB-like acyl-CoA dehydrogenase